MAVSLGSKMRGVRRVLGVVVVVSFLIFVFLFLGNKSVVKEMGEFVILGVWRRWDRVVVG